MIIMREREGIIHLKPIFPGFANLILFHCSFSVNKSIFNINYQEGFTYQNVYYMNEFGEAGFQKGWFTLSAIVSLYM